MANPQDKKFQQTGFPTLAWEEEDLVTRPMPLHELPLQARIDMEMGIVAEHNIRVAVAIESFWGRADCVEYLQTLILGGYHEGQKRMGFKPQVLAALINLAQLHQAKFNPDN